MSRRAAIAGALCAAVLASPARADDRPVALAIVDCPTLSDGDLRAAMRVELGVRLLAPDASAPGGDRVIVTCDGDRATVVADGAGLPPLARSISLADYPPDARPRLVTLVAVELLAARRASTPPLSPAPVPAMRDRPAPWRLLIGPAATVFLTERGLLAPSGLLRLERSITARWDLAADITAGGARRTIADGAVSAVLASAAGALLARQPLGRTLVLSAGAGARLGLAHLDGQPADSSAGRAVTRAWGGPLATAALSLCRDQLCGEIAVEGGVALLGARGFAGDSRAIAASGGWLGLALAAGWRF